MRLPEADPANAATYQANAAAYLARLKALDAYVQAAGGDGAARQRVLVTAHDAFHYFGRAYGFDVTRPAGHQHGIGSRHGRCARTWRFHCGTQDSGHFH